MGDISGTVTMSTSTSGDVADGVADSDMLSSAQRKLAEAEDPFPLPALPPVESALWVEIRGKYGLSLQETSALQNYVSRPHHQPRPRAILRHIEDDTFYRINDQRVRASFTISNTVNARQYVLDAELLVDPGANTELKLPARKVMQLGLTRLGAPTRSRGSTNNLRFFPVLVTATFNRDGVRETVQGALEVKCDMAEYEALQNQQVPPAGTNDGEQNLLTPNQPINGHANTGSSSAQEELMVIHLTPTRHRPHDAPLQQAVIGMDGLRKLHLHLNCDQLQLEIEEDDLLDDEEA